MCTLRRCEDCVCIFGDCSMKETHHASVMCTAAAMQLDMFTFILLTPHTRCTSTCTNSQQPVRTEGKCDAIYFFCTLSLEYQLVWLGLCVRSCVYCPCSQIKNAVEEQRKITQLRFARLLAEIAPPTGGGGAAAGGHSDGEDKRQISMLSRL